MALKAMINDHDYNLQENQEFFLISEHILVIKKLLKIN